MNAIDQEQKVGSGAVYGSATIDENMAECANPDCRRVFTKAPGKRYHSIACKNEYHVLERIAGKKALTRGKIKAALLENSPRLQRVARFLSDGKPHSTREIQRECDVCAVGTIKSELIDPKNGFDIICKQIGKDRWEYRMIGGFEQLLRIV
ncbi:hypothetical protein KAR91_32880 [Candidatus Pacearchaeota archaeon]|nr:hypothetical protein [Candidatus Pacearchaeota archaeon]